MAESLKPNDIDQIDGKLWELREELTRLSDVVRPSVASRLGLIVEAIGKLRLELEALADESEARREPQRSDPPREGPPVRRRPTPMDPRRNRRSGPRASGDR